ncbi:MAG: Asp-tRNA(Asn)/Glu-tRNA(Gln) amidotransferase subunit GatA [Clostridiales bacterium]|nr:Asp-tRNA(Asn)/Glu-tRNA(Gln) amidotransferase subunit GatA [Clostridiales bacterium]
MDLRRLTIKSTAKALREKEISAVELTEDFIKRIENVDKKIDSFVSVCSEKAIQDAKAAQLSIDSGEGSVLTGIPMAVKDNMCTEGITTTCSSHMLENFKPSYSSTAVETLIKDGAVLLGKLNLDEFAMGSSTENSYIKKTKNPWDLKRVPGGSSGGSAAAVASGQAIFALGSDTGGSIRQPASFCGVVGLKPTYGTVSRYGLVAFASSLDQIGPITKTVEDSAIVLNSISGKDPMDATSVESGIKDYTEGISGGVKGMRIGIPKQYLAKGVAPGVRYSINSAIAKYEKMGAICTETSLELADYAIAAYYIISSAEASSNLARYDGIKYGYRSSDFKNLIELYKNTRSEAFGAEVKRRIMLGTYVLSSGYYDAYYKKALQIRTLIKDEFDRLFNEFDCILGPTAPTTAYNIGEMADDPLQMYLGDVFTVSVNIAGLPAISIPCGQDESGLPVGMQLIGKAFSEKTLLKAAYAYEQENPFALAPEVTA